jgi:electron transfer flavoprotein alpha subunit
MKRGTLVIAQVDSGCVDEVTAELVTAALELGDPVTLGIAAVDPGSVENVSIPGVDRVLGIRLPNDQVGHEVQQRAVEALIDFSKAQLVLMPFSWETAAFAAGLAEKRDYCFASDVIGLSQETDGEIIVIRPVYGGKVCARLGLSAGIPTILLLRPGRWSASVASGSELVMEMVDVTVPDSSRVRLVKVIDPVNEDTDLKRADIIFAVGRGVGTRESIAMFEEIIHKFGVSLGASRPLVDVGLVPRALQIGQSGVTVSPKLYVAFGISGSLQHMAGISASTTIVAINTDDEAPIFDSAQFGAQVDAMEVARELLAEE